MSIRDLTRTLLQRDEVDHVDAGSEHLLSMRERREARERQAARLREDAANERHPKLYAAVRRRFGLLTK